MWYNGATDAVVAQLAEQLIRNEQVAGSIPVNGSIDGIMKLTRERVSFLLYAKRN